MADTVAEPKIKISVEHQAALKAFLETGNASKDLGKALDAMGKAIEASAGKVTASEKGYARFERTIAQMASELKGNGATAQLNMLALAVEKAGGTSALTAVQLDNLRNKIEGLKGAGGAVPASLAGITTETNKLQAAVSAATSGKGISGVLAAVSPAAAAAAAGLAGVSAAAVALAANAVKMAEWAEHIQNLGKASGLTAEKVQVLEYAAEAAGVSFESALKGAEKLEEKLGEDSEAFAQLGFDVEQLKALAPDQLFEAVAQKIAGLTTQYERNAAAVAVFGKAGAETYLPLIEQLAELEAQAKKTNSVLTGEQLAALTRLGDSVDELGGSWEGLKRQVAAYTADSPGARAAIETVSIALRSLSGVIKGLQGSEGTSYFQNLKFTFLQIALAVAQLGERIDHALGRSAETRSKAIVEDLRKQIVEIEALRTRGASGAEAGGGEPGEGKPGFIPKNKINVPGLGIVDKKDYEAMIAASDQFTHDRAQEQQKVAERNALSDQKDLADIAARQRKAAEDQAAQLLDIKVKEVARKKQITEAAARSEVEAEAKTSEFLSKRAAADAKLIAESQAVLAAATAKDTDSLKAKVDAIDAATAAAIVNVRATEDTSAAAQEEAVANREAAAAHLKGAAAAAAHQKAMQKLGQSLGEVRQAFGSFIGLLDELGVSEDSALGKAARLGEGLAGAGESFAAAAADWSTNPVKAVAEGIEGITQLVGTLKAVFSKPEWKRVAEDVGRDMGVSISQGLAESIAKDSKRVGDRLAGTLLHLKEIIEEAGGIEAFGTDKAIGQLQTLFSVLDRGEITVREAGKAFDDVFGDLADSVTRGGALASKQFLELIRLSRQFGIESQKLNEYLDRQAEAGIKGLRAFINNAKVTLQGAAEAIGAGLAGAYNVLIQQGKSPSEAFAELQPDIEKFRKQLEEAGLSGGVAFEQLEARAALFADEVTGPALNAVHGLTDFLGSLHNMGLLNQDTFSALTAQITATADALRVQGEIGPEALQALAPDLQRIWELQQQFGYAVDEGTQALLDQALAAGAVGEAHQSASDRMLGAMERTANAMEALARALGVVLPDAARKGADGVNDALGRIKPPDVTLRVRYDNGTLPNPPDLPPIPGFAGGSDGLRDFGPGTVAVLHGAEAVLTREQYEARQGSPVTISMGSHTINVGQGSQGPEADRALAERISEMLRVNDNAAAERVRRIARDIAREG